MRWMRCDASVGRVENESEAESVSEWAMARRSGCRVGSLGVALKAIFSPVGRRKEGSECGGGAKVRPPASPRLLRLSPSPSHPRRDRHSPRSLAQFGAAAAAVDRFAAGVPTCYIASPTHRATQQPTKFQGVSSDAVVIISFCRVLEQPRRRYEPGHSVMM